MQLLFTLGAVGLTAYTSADSQTASTANVTVRTESVHCFKCARACWAKVASLKAISHSDLDNFCSIWLTSSLSLTLKFDTLQLQRVHVLQANCVLCPPNDSTNTWLCLYIYTAGGVTIVALILLLLQLVSVRVGAVPATCNWCLA